MHNNHTAAQAAFIAYCNQFTPPLLYEFAGDTLAYNWYRQSGKWRFGEMEYRLYGCEWIPRANGVEKIEVR